MTSRIPPSRRDPRYAPERAAKVVGQQTPGAGRVAGVAKQGVSQPVAAAIRGSKTAPTSAAGGGLRPATLVFAADDSHDDVKAGADVVCDGTDDDVAIQAAIDAAYALGGPTSVLLLPGTYYFTGAVSLSQPYSSISGPGSIINVEGIDGAVRLQAQHQSAHDLFIQCGNVGSSNSGLRLSADDTSAYNVTVTGTTGGDYPCNFGIKVDGDRVRVSSCEVVFAQIGVDLQSSTLPVVVGNVLSACAIGINCNNAVEPIVTNNHLTGVAIFSSYGVGIAAKSTSGGLRPVIQGNVIVGHFHGIESYTRGAQILGNTVRESRRYGIYCYGDDSKVSDNLVVGSGQESSNTYENIRITSAGSRISVTGNTCRKQTFSSGGTSSGNSASYGLLIGSSTADTFVSHNDLKNGGQSAAYSDSGTGTITGAANRT